METPFYLKSKENKKLYPPNRYPLTHSIHSQTIEYEISKKLGEIKNFLPIFFVALFWTSLYIYCYNGHIRIYNNLFGPFHLNLKEFEQHVEDFVHQKYNFYEYIQVEFGEGNIIQNSKDSSETIRQYSNPTTRRPHQHIATFKEVKNPNIFVKLPTRNVPQVRKRFSFDFYQFSLETLKCILGTLISKTSLKPGIKFKEKSDIVNYIQKEYSKNSTSFNMLILTKCGILIGYLYNPKKSDERAFLPKKEHIFYADDIAFEVSLPYFTYFSIEALNIVVFGFCGICLIYYCAISIIFPFLSFPLRIEKDDIKKLKKLENFGSWDQQLLKLDELLDQCELRFKDQLFIIKDRRNGEYFIVILPISILKIANYYTKTSSFLIYPTSDIRGVTTEGIYYGKGERIESEGLIKWPTIISKEKKEYSEWFKEKLLVISDRYEKLVDRIELEKLTNQEEKLFKQNHPQLASVQLNPIRALIERSPIMALFHRSAISSFIQRNPQWFRNIYPEIDGYPVSARKIAKFRLRQSKNKKYVKKSRENEICSICLEKFILGEEYEVWPCGSIRDHVFHYECILKQFRMNNACPICRGQAEF